MCRQKCQLILDAEKRVQNADSEVAINFIIMDIAALLKLAEKRKEELGHKAKVKAIRDRLEHDRSQLADTNRSRFQDIETLLAIIDEKIPEYAPMKEVAND